MLSPELIAKIAQHLEEIPPKPSSRQEIDLLLTGIEKQIRAAQERGCSYADIAQQITASGYAIKTSTLRTAMQRRRDAEAKSVKRRRVGRPVHSSVREATLQHQHEPTAPALSSSSAGRR